MFSGKYFLKRTRYSFLSSNYLLVIAFLIASVISFSLITIPFSSLAASTQSNKIVFEPTDKPNDPIGVAKGIFPGRVIWCFNPNAAKWSGKLTNSNDDAGNTQTLPEKNDDWFSEANTIQSEVDKMISQTICKLTGKSTDAEAWDAIFKYFNKAHQKGEVGYKKGEKIAVKINLNSVGHGKIYKGSHCTSPQMVFGLLKQLVKNANVPEENITFYDVSFGRGVPDAIFDLCRKDFPLVNFVDSKGGNGRLKSVIDSNNQLKFSQELVLEPLANPAYPTYLPTCITEAQYLINFAVLKSHNLAGVTLCAKNHFGSFMSPNTEKLQYPQAAGVHPYVAVRNLIGFKLRPMKSYNVLVDLMGHKQLGGKTLLFLVDGLYGERDAPLDYRCKWNSAPFNGNWTSSFFASFDNVAIESVCLDFLRTEQSVSQFMTNVTGTVDNYLHEAALANDPPSGASYHPDGSTRLESLGAHEHWNNQIDKQYSRNLGTGKGIELIPLINSPSLQTSLKE